MRLSQLESHPITALAARPATRARAPIRPRLAALVAPILLFAGGCIVIDGLECHLREERSAVVPAPASLGEVEVRARAGDLAIHGRADAAEVRVTGVACARHRRDLEGIQIEARADGDRIVVEAVIPEPARRRGARLDLTLDVPAAARVKVVDTSGDITLDGVAAANVDDESGDLRVDRVAGEVTIHDQSGDVVIDGSGPVRIDDDSGDVTISDAAAVTVVDDGSGDLDFSKITGDVTVLDDGSGDITATGVGGNLKVVHDGSGDVRYDGVAGIVDVPDKRGQRSLPAEAPQR